jgi:hypothetical protein
MILKTKGTAKFLAEMVRYPQIGRPSFSFDENDGRHIWVYELPNKWIICKTGDTWEALVKEFEVVRGRAELFQSAGNKVYICGLTNKRRRREIEHYLYFGPFNKMMPAKKKEPVRVQDDPTIIDRNDPGWFVETVDDVLRALHECRPDRMRRRKRA